ncbi:hypothetical protein RRG08_026157 [Elysia crispata]|uniref:Uncharacterized protein n=1 Tax=Elysia crispata TaxID=231223 RepID=A0AAE0ZB50_9GAST|nr:hypothetical protein RRG08_026157 [Elysia crispata]
MFLKDQNTVRKARSNVEEDTTPPLLDGFDTEYETEEGVATAYDSDGEPQDNTSVEHMVSTLSTPRSGK